LAVPEFKRQNNRKADYDFGVSTNKTIINHNHHKNLRSKNLIQSLSNSRNHLYFRRIILLINYEVIHLKVFFAIDPDDSTFDAMNIKNIVTLRLLSQQLAGTKFNTAKEIVSWMGAMQAQDFSMAKWAVGTRLPGSTDKIIQRAIDAGEIIRTHALRPTWHFVSPDDIYWILELSSPQIKSQMKSISKTLELTDSVFTKSNNLLERALAGNKHRTREELMIILRKAKINTDSFRSAHLMMQAELDGIVCSGITKDKKQTYTLLRNA
jgi:hypothetical protein